ncbi:hypothetical protein KIPB_002249 [Kipferlia bialata]|uniref:Uncharacterized protein n=1 Tax=Kipferlia bialata TaxID=797122 RepID=A0A9K3CRY7_9EUKA|nr:hypothetical protein KIPB_002249 [Kipferlia bialata]|eukprot:g2249.t1
MSGRRQVWKRRRRAPPDPHKARKAEIAKALAQAPREIPLIRGKPVVRGVRDTMGPRTVHINRTNRAPIKAGRIRERTPRSYYSTGPGISPLTRSLSRGAMRSRQTEDKEADKGGATPQRPVTSVPVQRHRDLLETLASRRPSGMNATAPGVPSLEVNLKDGASGKMLANTTSILSQLRMDENHLQTCMRDIERDRTRRPVQGWYEMKGAGFTEEHMRHNQWTAPIQGAKLDAYNDMLGGIDGQPGMGLKVGLGATPSGIASHRLEGGQRELGLTNVLRAEIDRVMAGGTVRDSDRHRMREAASAHRSTSREWNDLYSFSGSRGERERGSVMEPITTRPSSVGTSTSTGTDMGCGPDPEAPARLSLPISGEARHIPHTAPVTVAERMSEVSRGTDSMEGVPLSTDQPTVSIRATPSPSRMNCTVADLAMAAAAADVTLVTHQDFSKTC